MKLPHANFWTWFAGFAGRLPEGDPPEELLDELLGQLHAFDDRIYFELATNCEFKELILTGGGDVEVFPTIENLIAAAPTLNGWTFVALKPAQGFAFTHSDNGIELDASKLWFLPLKSESGALGVCLGIPDVDRVLERQTVDTAYTILETGIGERRCALEIQHVEVDELPPDPRAAGFAEIGRLAEYLDWHKGMDAS